VSKKNTVVVITGASSGVGRATALRFARTGACLVLAARREGPLHDVVDECERLGASAVAVVTDVTNPDAVDALAAAAVENFGAIDVWVNCAAVAVYAEFTTVPLHDFRRVLDVNVMGYVHGARSALEVMEDQGRGVIVNVASIVGEVPQPYASSYGMSKAAVRALGASLRQELTLKRQKRIHVVTVMPPTLDTPFFGHAANYTGRALRAMPPVYSPDEVAKTIVKSVRKPRVEIIVGAAGKALVRQHRTHPASAEAEMAVLVENGQFRRKEGAGATAGNLYAPSPDSDAAVSGGWHGRSRSGARSVLLWLLLLGAGAVVALFLLGGDESSAKSVASKKSRSKKAHPPKRRERSAETARAAAVFAALKKAEAERAAEAAKAARRHGPDDAVTVLKKTQRNLRTINRGLVTQAKANR
jgi:short-subunit dehydrogenase